MIVNRLGYAMSSIGLLSKSCAAPRGCLARFYWIPRQLSGLDSKVILAVRGFEGKNEIWKVPADGAASNSNNNPLLAAMLRCPYKFRPGMRRAVLVGGDHLKNVVF